MPFSQKIKKHLLLIIGFLALFSWYLYNLKVFPIFADEAIYLNWAQRVIQGETNPFISVYDGKTPLFIWASGLLSTGFKSLLFAGRLASVLGLFLGSFFIFKLLVKKSFSWALTSSFLILTLPFTFFHSRLALHDTFLSVFLALAVLVWSTSQVKFKGLFTGILMGLAFYSKTPAMFLLPLPYLSIFFSKEKKMSQLVQATISTFIFGLFVLTLKITPWFPSLFSRSKDFTFTFKEIFNGQNNHFWPNFRDLISWSNFYMTWPVLVLFILGAIKAFKKKNLTAINLVLSTILFASPLIILGRVVSPRYYLPLGLFIPIVASYYLKGIKKDLIILIVAGVFAIALPINYLFQLNPFISHLPKRDDAQYLEDWSSGIGIEGVSSFINIKAQNNSVKVFTEGYFGTLPDGLFVHQFKKPMSNLEIVGVGSPYTSTFIEELEKSQADFNYYVGNHDRINSQSRDAMQLIQKFDKKNDGPQLELYLINKQ